MAIICIDTQILSWGLIKKPPPNKPQIIHQASDFLRWVEEQKHRVIIPSIVVGELLTAVPSEDHSIILGKFQKSWRIVDFNPPAAQRFAILRREHAIKNKLNELIDPSIPGATRAGLKADVMIIAVAIVNQAQIIYSHDGNLLRIAEG